MKLKHILYIILSLAGQTVIAQEIDNSTSYKNINSDKYIRFSIDNDYFSARDQQYTEGANLEVVLPTLKHFPLAKALINPHYSYSKYGIGFEQAGYTPNNLQEVEVPIYDHPFAATFFLKTFVISIDTIGKQKFGTTLSTGLIGPDALGDEVQDAAHKWLHNVIPNGWKYQIHDDVILNYQVNYERQLFAFRKLFSFTTDLNARTGTLSDKAGIGVTAIVGYFDNVYTSANQNNKFHLFMYDRSAIDFIGYDATLEGGVFNHTSPYTIAPSDLNRAVFMNRVGWVLAWRRITLEYFQTYTSSQFSTGPRNKWGGIQVAMNL